MLRSCVHQIILQFVNTTQSHITDLDVLNKNLNSSLRSSVVKGVVSEKNRNVSCYISYDNIPAHTLLKCNKISRYTPTFNMNFPIFKFRRDYFDLLRPVSAER